VCSRGIAKLGEPNNLIVNTIRGGGIRGNYLEPEVAAVLRKKQQRLVLENPGVLEAIAKGAKQAVDECKHQFRNRRWNCTTKDYWRGKNLFGKIVGKGKKIDSSFSIKLPPCKKIQLSTKNRYFTHKNHTKCRKMRS